VRSTPLMIRACGVFDSVAGMAPRQSQGPFSHVTQRPLLTVGTSLSWMRQEELDRKGKRKPRASMQAKRVPCGKICLSLSIMPKARADAQPVRPCVVSKHHHKLLRHMIIM
jgi:hypothetical protein